MEIQIVLVTIGIVLGIIGTLVFLITVDKVSQLEKELEELREFTNFELEAIAEHLKLNYHVRRSIMSQELKDTYDALED